MKSSDDSILEGFDCFYTVSHTHLTIVISFPVIFLILSEIISFWGLLHFFFRTVNALILAVLRCHLFA